MPHSTPCSGNTQHQIPSWALQFYHCPKQSWFLKRTTLPIPQIHPHFLSILNTPEHNQLLGQLSIVKKLKHTTISFTQAELVNQQPQFSINLQQEGHPEDQKEWP